MLSIITLTLWWSRLHSDALNISLNWNWVKLLIIFHQCSPKTAKPAWFLYEILQRALVAIFIFSLSSTLYAHYMHCVASFILYTICLYHTHPLLLFRGNKSEIQEWVEDEGMSLHHQAIKMSSVRTHSTERTWPKGEVLVMDTSLKSQMWADTAIWILDRIQHSSLVQNQSKCMCLLSVNIFAWCTYSISAVLCMFTTHAAYVYINLPAHTLYVSRCLYDPACLCLMVCVFSSWGYKKTGPSAPR